MAATHDESVSRLALMTTGQLRPWTQQEQQLQDSTLSSNCTAGQRLIGASANHGLQDSVPDTPIAGLVLGDGLYAQLSQSKAQLTAEGAVTASEVCPASPDPCCGVAADAADDSHQKLLEATSVARCGRLQESSGSDEDSEDSDCTDTDNSEEAPAASGESSHSSTTQAGSEEDELSQHQQEQEQQEAGLPPPAPAPKTICSGLDITPKLAPATAALVRSTATAPTVCSAHISRHSRKQQRLDAALTPAAVTAAAARIVSVSSSITAAASGMMSYTVQAIARLAARQHQRQQHQQQYQQHCTVHTHPQQQQQQQPGSSEPPQALLREELCQLSCSTYMRLQQQQGQQQPAQAHDAWQTKRHSGTSKHPVPSNLQAAQQQQQQQHQHQQQQQPTAAQQQQPFHQMVLHDQSKCQQAGGLCQQKLQHPGLSSDLSQPQQHQLHQLVSQATSSSFAQSVRQAAGCNAVNGAYSSKNTARKATAASDCTVSSRLTTKHWQQVKRRQQQQALAAQMQQQQDEDAAAQSSAPMPCIESESAIAAAAAALRHAGEAAAAAMAAAGRGPKQHMHDAVVGAQQHLTSSTKCKPAHFIIPPPPPAAAAAGEGATGHAVKSCRPAAAIAIAEKLGSISCSGIAQKGCILPVVPAQHGVSQTCGGTVSNPEPSSSASVNLHLPHITSTETSVTSVAQQHVSRPSSPTRVDFSQLEGELAVVGISSCTSSRSSSPLGCRCSTRDGLRNHYVSRSSAQQPSSTCSAGSGTSEDCTAGSTRGRPAAVPRLVLPRLPSIKEKLQPSSQDATPTSAAAKAVQQQHSPQHMTQASPHGLGAVVRLSTTARSTQQNAVEQQHLVVQGLLASQGVSSSSCSSRSPITAAGSVAAADAAIAGSPWHSNRSSTQQNNGLMLHQAIAPVGYAALSSRVYEIQGNPAAAAAVAPAQTAAGAANVQGQSASIHASSAKQQVLGRKNSRKARGSSGSSAGTSSRPGSSNCQNRASCNRPQSTGGINSIDTHSSNAPSGCGTQVGKSSSCCGSGNSRPQSQIGSSRLGSSSGSGPPSRCVSATLSRGSIIRSGRAVRSNSISNRQTSLGGAVSRPGSSCSSSSACTADPISGTCKAEAVATAPAAAAAAVTMIATEAAESKLQQHATPHAHQSSSSSGSGTASESAAADVPAACAYSEEQPSLHTTPGIEKHKVTIAGYEHRGAAVATAAVDGYNSSSSSVQGGINTDTADVAREQQQQQGNVAQQQQQQQQEQHAVHTAGLPFTLVTSVLGDSNATAPGRHLLELQLQRLEHQSAQLAPVGLLETPKLPAGVAAAAAAAMGGVVAAAGHLKVVTAHQAKAAAKHLQQQQQPVGQQQASNTDGQHRQQQHIQSQSLAQLASVKGHSKPASTASKCASKPVAAVAAAAAAAAAEVGVEAGSLQQLRHQGSVNTAKATPVCSDGAGVIGGAVESNLAVAVVAAVPAAVVGTSAVASDAAKIVDAATRAGPAHMQDIWA